MILSQPFRGIWRISQLFGENAQIYSQFGLDGHNGIDFGIPTDTEVLAATDATVIVVSDQGNSGYGKYIRLRTHDDYELTYGHLHTQLVSVGQQVHTGDVIALSDNTGFSTGPHLHFGVRQFTANTNSIANYGNGYKGAIDPLPFFQPQTIPVSPPVIQPDPELVIAETFVIQNNLIHTIHGSNPLLRQDAARILYRFARHFGLVSSPSVIVTNGDSELAQAEQFVAQYQLLSNVDGDKPLLRQDAARVFFRFAQHFHFIPSHNIATTADAELNAAITFMVQNQLMNAQDGSLPLLRQDAVRILYRFAKKFNLIS